jgi:WS/DGAT/MGAT family acyltransferase
MARMSYERLSRESAAFLAEETSRQRAHTTMILVFEGGDLVREDGGVDFDRIRLVLETALGDLPRLRSKLRRVPGDGHPVWVDDAEFNLDYHLRQSSLPRPGTLQQLEKTAARIAASRLDRSRPLWDCWVIEGLENGRFALIVKMHKALAAYSHSDLLGTVLSIDEERTAIAIRAYRPRPAPSPAELFSLEVIRSWSPSRRAIARGVEVVTHPAREMRRIRNQARSLLQALGYALRPASESPFDARLGPHRSFAFCEVPLSSLQEIHRSLGGGMHDAVLTLISGAMRRFFAGRLVNPVTVDLRAVTPVLDASETKASPWVIELPVWESSGVERLGLIREQTRPLRQTSASASGESLVSGDVWSASRLFAIGACAFESLELGQIVVLQAPGPQKSLYLDGARLASCYGVLPLRDESGLGISALSYDGKLFFAFNADTEIVPDLPELSDAIEEELSEMLSTARSSGRSLRALSA